jgi:integrase/recombinase XerD
VTGKGRRQRACPFGNKTAQALDRYLRMRARHKLADDPKLWVTEKNRPAMTANGISQMIRKPNANYNCHAIRAHVSCAHEPDAICRRRCRRTGT